MCLSCPSTHTMSWGHSRDGWSACAARPWQHQDHGQRVPAARSTALGTAAPTPPPPPSPNASSLKPTRGVVSARHAMQFRHATAPIPPLRPGEPRVNEAHRGDLCAPHLPPRALCRAQVCRPRLEPATALPPAAAAALCSHRPPACADTTADGDCGRLRTIADDSGRQQTTSTDSRQRDAGGARHARVHVPRVR